MTLNRLASSSVATIRPDCVLSEAARLMDMFSVGALLITETDDGAVKGIVTDRDLVRAIGQGAAPAKDTVARFAERKLETLRADGPSLRQVAEHMARSGVRRLPVVDEQGRAVGIVSLDDLLVELGEDLGNLAAAIKRGFSQEHPAPPGHDRTT